jgi:hypothetical protein
MKPASLLGVSGSPETLLGEARKAVGAPLLAADTVVDEEEPVRIEFRLDGFQLRIVLAPKLLPPGGIEEVAFVEYEPEWGAILRSSDAAMPIPRALSLALAISIGDRTKPG